MPDAVEDGPCLSTSHCPVPIKCNKSLSLSLYIYLTNKNVDLAIRSGQQKPSEMRI